MENNNYSDAFDDGECIELKNIKYKTMLMTGIPIKETKSSNDLSNIEKFLEDEKNSNQNEPWSKLNKTIKTQKLIQFAEIYAKDKNLTDDEKQSLIQFFKDCLDRKKLFRVKDVSYNKLTGEIKDIPALLFHKQSNHFTLKNIDKRVNTLKNLPTGEKTRLEM